MNPVLYTRIIQAALEDDEDGLRAGLNALNQSELSRLRNVMHNVAELAEGRRAQLWRTR